jgi:hypothetical protein
MNPLENESSRIRHAGPHPGIVALVFTVLICAFLHFGAGFLLPKTTDALAPTSLAYA